jgi:hypothetical protein
MTHISEEHWTADCGIDENRPGNFTCIVYGDDGVAVAVAHGKTAEQARERADAIAELPYLIDEKF